jgi:hypothetical protein
LDECGKISGIDLLIVSGARPVLLRKTIESFSAGLFKNFKIENALVNIDRFGGDDADVENCEGIIRQEFPDATVRKPREPSFTNAVKWLWESTSAPYCLHIEDDWRLLCEVFPDDIFPLFEGAVRQVSFLTKEKKWRFKYPFHVKAAPRKILRWRVGWRLLEDHPVFTTSPSFIERGFANTCGLMMKESFDPEKQLYRGLNRELQEYTRSYQNRLLWNSDGYMIKDIGREYREAHGIIKTIVDGQSVWRSQ